MRYSCRRIASVDAHEKMEKTTGMMYPEWLSLILQGSPDEIYVLDGRTLQFLQASTAACLNLQYADAEQSAMTWLDVLEGETTETVNDALHTLRDGSAAHAAIKTVHLRKDGSSYAIEFRVFHDRSDGLSRLIAIGRRHAGETAAALLQGELRFHAIASNSPGLVYQFLLRHNNNTNNPKKNKNSQTQQSKTTEQLR